MRQCVFILGMHRSGTSALSGVINLLGMDLGLEIIPGNTFNAKGYFENNKVNLLNEKILRENGSSWYDSNFNIKSLNVDKFTEYVENAKDIISTEFRSMPNFAIKDPRICILFPIWEKACLENRIEIKIILPYRNPLEVAVSLKKRDGLSFEKSILLWTSHFLNAEYYSRTYKRLFISFDELLNDTKNSINLISDLISLKSSNELENKINKFLDKKFKNHNLPIDKFPIEIPTFLRDLLTIIKNRNFKNDKNLTNIHKEFAIFNNFITNNLSSEIEILKKSINNAAYEKDEASTASISFDPDNDSLIKIIEKKDSIILEREESIEQNQIIISGIQKVMFDLESEIKNKQNQIYLFEKSVNEMNCIQDQNMITINEQNIFMKKMQNQIHLLENKITEKDELISIHSTKINLDKVLISNNHFIIKRKEEIIRKLQFKLISKSKQVYLKNNTYIQLDRNIEIEKGKLKDKEKELQLNIITIANIKESLSFKIGFFLTAPARYIHTIFRLDHIKNNKPLLWLKLIYTAIQKPTRSFKHINSKNFKTLFKALKNENPKTIFNNFTKLISNNKIAEPDPFQIIKFKPIQWRENKSIEKPPVKVLAFYLPQFHAIPENNFWWGKGFTEWTNVKPAKPQFEGHYQPQIPGDLGYYNLLDKKTQLRQVELAKNYGIGGFCFHFYWFEGKRLLEEPILNYLKNSKLNLPFCLSWANENWSRRWDGRDDDILIKQNHSKKDDIDYIKYISKYIKDSRYIRIDSKPLVLVYRPELLPSAVETANTWRKWCRINGIGEIYLAYVQSFEKPDPKEYGFDAAIEFPPNNFYPPVATHRVKPISKDFNCNIYDWKVMADNSNNYSSPDYKLFRGVCPSWDNTARRKNNGTIFTNHHPNDFKKWVYNAAIDTYSRFENEDERLIFVNAWNEWAEGTCLEPNKKFGYAYLQNIYDVLEEVSNNNANNIINESK